MTTRATCSLVARMIETHSKTRKPRERLHRSRLCVRMTDRANLVAGVGKLFRVTTGARSVVPGAGHRRTRLARFPSMAQQARQPRVVRVVVLELRKIGARRLRRSFDRPNYKRERH